LFAKEWQSYKTKEDDLGEVHNLHWRVKKMFQIVRSLKLTGRNQLADHDIDGRIILTWIVDEM